MAEHSSPVERQALGESPFVLSAAVLVALILVVYGLSIQKGDGGRDLRGRYGNTTTESYVGEGLVDTVTGAALESQADEHGATGIFPVRPDRTVNEPE